MMKSLFTPTAALLAVAFATHSALAHEPSSGMLLGVYAFENHMGLRVTGTIPGYSAEGRLYANDVLTRATVDGVHVYSIRTRNEIEWAKDQIGPYTPAAIEVWRPGVGTIYFWVEFQPVGGGAAYAQSNGASRQMKAQFKTEAEKPGARALFQRGGAGVSKPMPPAGNRPQRPSPPQGMPQPSPKPPLSGGVKLDPGSLFGR
jgi:hypothetical protein